MNYKIKFFKTTISNRMGIVELIAYPNNCFIIKFLNDQYSDYTTSYDSNGFGIELSQDKIKFDLNGKVDIKIAEEIWNDISSRIDNPDYEIDLTGFFQ